ncbi:DUF2971 domain-containing protein [Motilimonas eburnea]|uniref:DUF2971 domain-containing protein n=1 Tax=Motilimonas eburnea TaxID=1737488 RepID=UPI001E6519D7|nr:DUF2971 domain-containing protein [Motilimonas eburnea]MCE2573311.1 DUF2971 domain-containing protein [Motilimonas eburnea]
MMNDPLETKIDNDLLHELYTNEFSESELPQNFYFKRNNIDEFQYRAFGFSTSKSGDDLSQWRSYTQKTKGVCIEFDKEALEKQLVKLLHEKRPVSCECVYSITKERELLQRYVQLVRSNGWYKVMNQSNPEFMEHGLTQFEYMLAFQEMAIQIKHESFEPESEIRFFLLQDNFNGDIEIKPCAGGLTRYVNVNITPECIKSIRTGPLVDKRNKFMIQELFMSKMDKFVEVSETASPYL